MTPWISNAPNGQAFAAAEVAVAALKADVSQANVEALATAGVHGVVDGGYTDNSGVANAIAAGAEEIVALVNNDAASALSYLFAGGPAGGKPYQPASLFPVFSSPSASEAATAFHAFRRLEVPTSSLYLKEMAVGTLTAVTAPNKAWGLSPRTVTLHIVSVSSSLNIGEFENLAHYDALAQEIAQAIVAKPNAPLVASTLLPMMLGADAAA